MDKHKLIITLLVLTYSVLNAQDFKIEKTDTTGLYRLSEVVVSATKTATSSLEVASSVSVIDSAEIANKNSFNAADLLKDQYGVYFAQQGGPGKLESIFMRGGNSNHTLVLIDGIEMNMPMIPAILSIFQTFPLITLKR